MKMEMAMVMAMMQKPVAYYCGGDDEQAFRIIEALNTLRVTGYVQMLINCYGNEPETIVGRLEPVKQLFERMAIKGESFIFDEVKVDAELVRLDIRLRP
ncbi:MAG: hypothetical protein HYZ09_02665 [Candidatus Kerfeldbacteria bacterium]|nr:hypothetical protein [Candidatus Kerfeldbacteria bacterium]